MPIYAYGKRLKDNNGNIIYPVTKSNLVYMENNMTVEEILGQFNPPIENKELTSVLQNDSLIYNFTDNYTGAYGNYIFFSSYSVVEFIIKLDKNTPYKLTKLRIEMYLRMGDSLPLLSTSLMSYSGAWPPSHSYDLTFDKDIPCEPFTSFSDTVDVPLNIADCENKCIKIQLRNLNGLIGGVTITAFGDVTGELPVIQESTFYTQICNTNFIDGRPNPFKGKSLESILNELNKKITSIK